MILINPSIHSESQSKAITPFIYNTFPTGLGCLAGYLRQYNNVTPEIVDEQIQPLSGEQLEKLIAGLKEPRIVGFSLLTINCWHAYELADRIKQIDPGVLVVAGGIHATVLPEECLSDRGIDIVVRREGERTISELVDRVQNQKSWYDLQGISYKQNGEFIHNIDRPLIQDLNEIPPFPYELIDHNKDYYRDFGTVITSRGCPFDCIFCSQRAITGRQFRAFDVERVLDEVGVLVNKYEQDNIWFMDDNFIVDKKRVFSLLNGIISRGYHKKAGFVAEMRGDSVTYELLNKMKEANFKIMSLGMETLVPRLLDKVEKRETVEQNIQAVKMAHEVGLSTSTTFIFGLPTETREDRKYTAQKARKLPLDDARFNVAVPYPGTKLYEIAKAEGTLKIKQGWSNFNVQSYMFHDDIPYAPSGTTRAELIRDTYMANLFFNLQPRVLKSWLMSPISGGMVLTLPEKWYFSPREIGKLFSLAALFVKRFFGICFLKGRAGKASIPKTSSE